VEVNDLPSSSLGALSFTSSCIGDSSLSTSSDSTLTGGDSRELDGGIAGHSQSEDEPSNGNEDGGFGFEFSLSLSDDESQGKKPVTSNSKRRKGEAEDALSLLLRPRSLFQLV